MLGALTGGGDSVGPIVVVRPPCGAGRRMRSPWRDGRAEAAGCGLTPVRWEFLKPPRAAPTCLVHYLCSAEAWLHRKGVGVRWTWSSSWACTSCYGRDTLQASVSLSACQTQSFLSW